MACFNDRVYHLVARIPRGKVTSYGRIAVALGSPRAAREVGWAMAAIPDELNLPAHRVVRVDGAMAGGRAFGSPAVQRALLEAEGVGFQSDGRVDLRLHLWEPVDDAEDDQHGGRHLDPETL